MAAGSGYLYSGHRVQFHKANIDGEEVVFVERPTDGSRGDCAVINLPIPFRGGKTVRQQIVEKLLLNVERDVRIHSAIAADIKNDLFLAGTSTTLEVLNQRLRNEYGINIPRLFGLEEADFEIFARDHRVQEAYIRLLSRQGRWVNRELLVEIARLFSFSIKIFTRNSRTKRLDEVGYHTAEDPHTVYVLFAGNHFNFLTIKSPADESSYKTKSKSFAEARRLLSELNDVLAGEAIGVVEASLEMIQAPVSTIMQFISLKEIQKEFDMIFEGMQLGVMGREGLADDADEAAYATAFKIQQLHATMLLEFMQAEERYLNHFFANAPALRSAFFGEVSQTATAIKRQYRMWSRFFHPDKIRPQFRSALTKKYNAVFSIITACKTELLENLAKQCAGADQIEYYLQGAQQHYRTALEFKSLAKWKAGTADATDKARVDALKYLHKDLLGSLSVDELQEHKKKEAFKSADFYRSAMLLADQQAKSEPAFIIKQIEYRQHQGVLMYMAGLKLEAQLYVLSAMRLALDLENPAEMAKQIQTLRGYLARIAHPSVGGTAAAAASRDTTPEHADERETLAIVPVERSMIRVRGRSVPIGSATGRAKIRQAIHKDISDVAVRSLLRGNMEIVSCQVHRDFIIQTRASAVMTQAGGAAMAGLGAGAVVASGVGMASTVGTIVTAVGEGAAIGSLGGPIGIGIGIASGLIAGVAGVVFGWKIFKKGQHMRAEPKRRENLNKIIAEAIRLLEQENNANAFIKEFGSAYGEDAATERLFTVNFDSAERIIRLEVRAQVVVAKLIKHGFRPDGIAYLLSLLAEVLINRNLNCHGISQQELDAMAIPLLREIVESATLAAEAKKLDRAIQKGRSESSSPLQKRFYRYWINSYAHIPEDYFIDGTVAPFCARLEEIRNIALMNQAILRIVMGGEDDLAIAVENVRKVETSVDSNYQYFSVQPRRLRALQDFLAAIAPGLEPTEEMDLPRLPDIVTSTVSSVRSLRMHGKEFFCEPPVKLNPDMAIAKLFAALLNVYLSRDEVTFATTTHPDADAVRDLLAKESDGQLKVRHLQTHQKLISQIYNVELIHCSLRQEGQTFFEVEEPVPVAAAGAGAATRPIRYKYRVYLCYSEHADEYSQAFIAKDDRHLVLLYKRFQTVVCSDEPDLAQIEKVQLEIAKHYCNLGERLTSRNHISGLRQWRFARRQYANILRDNPECVEAILGRARCLVQMAQFEKAGTFLRSYKGKTHITSHPDYWYWLAIADRRQHHYFDARIATHQGLQIAPKDARLAHEDAITTKLQGKTVKDYRVILLDTAPAPKEVDYNWQHDTQGNQCIERKYYNVFAIDGGGVRGIIPAVWLAEIERRANRPISHMAHMLSGTSTGGIIAAGLSVPARGSHYVPAYSASALVELYRTRSKDIFSRTWTEAITGTIGLFTPKYPDRGRLTLLTEYFGDARLKKSLTDLVITTVDEAHLNDTFLFTRHAARRDPSQNYRILDATMATSAAPTFFPAYKLAGMSFVDGGVQANNPALLAHEQALSYGIDPANIRVWSFGTGDCVSNLDNIYASRSKLFWAANFPRAAMSAQQGNADAVLAESLRTRYQRWQVWFESEVTLDDYSDASLDSLIEYAREAVEEMDASDDNQLNKTVEALIEDTPYAAGASASSPLGHLPFYRSASRRGGDWGSDAGSGRGRGATGAGGPPEGLGL